MKRTNMDRVDEAMKLGIAAGIKDPDARARFLEGWDRGRELNAPPPAEAPPAQAAPARVLPSTSAEWVERCRQIAKRRP